MQIMTSILPKHSTELIIIITEVNKLKENCQINNLALYLMIIYHKNI